ncbi:MAG TPA: HAMP domain-containing protein, partial [Thermoanaerobaculia bacterium]|nr:HAMP domain-containing protein [Thermoanaerobaculia bacterium]
MRTGSDGRSSTRQNGGSIGKQALRKLAAEVPEESRGKGNGNGEGSGKLDGRTLLAALTSFRRGDFSVRLSEAGGGEDLKIAEVFNEVVEMNERLARELERVARVVGKEGRLHQRAALPDARGSWNASLECVNNLIGDLVHPTTETARVIGAVAKGDLSQSMALEKEGRPLEGEFLRTARTVNTMVDQLSSFAAEVTRVARE